MIKNKYPLTWAKNNFSIKIFCSIPNVATGILLNANENYFIVDPGDGILRDIIKELTPTKILSISNFFVTHGHHDHIGGVWSLLTYLRVMRKKTSLNIFYPEGCAEIESIYNAFLKVYSKSLSYKINLIAIDSARKFKVKNVLITPFEVVHKEYLSDNQRTRLVPALGFKFSFNKIKICYGGDTAYCSSLVKMTKNSDLAILEAGFDEKKIKNDIHMTIEEAKSIGLTAKKYFLVHVPYKDFL